MKKQELRVQMPDKLLERMDRAIEERGYTSRSEFIRTAIRLLLRECTQLEEMEKRVKE